MDLNHKKWIIAGLGAVFLISLLLVQWAELSRRAKEQAGEHDISATADSEACISCHTDKTPGIVDHWNGSTHAELSVGCYECHQAKEGEPDAWNHEGKWIATIVTPKDCSKCHEKIYEEFEQSHHAHGGKILHSLDNILAEAVEGFRGTEEFPDPHNPGRMITLDGLAAADSGCRQCHGSKVALFYDDDRNVPADQLIKLVTVENVKDIDVSKIKRDKNGMPMFDPKTWPNTGIGRLNLDGSLGSCTACHSRHDFSARRARQPENCGKCHLGPDHPQKEIYEESKHGIAYRDLREDMNLDSDTWVLGKDYSAAPTCATCHMSATSNQPITHDPGKRISWTNRPPISLRLDTDKDHKTITTLDLEERNRLLQDGGMSWQKKRENMMDVCKNCHSPSYVDGFYQQYDSFIHLYNEKYGKPGTRIMKALLDNNIRTKKNFDDKIEWTWFYLWHHEGRRARHGASMMAPDYTHWHGTFEVAERWYIEFIPEAREMCQHAREDANGDEARIAQIESVEKLIDEIMATQHHDHARDVSKIRHPKEHAKEDSGEENPPGGG